MRSQGHNSVVYVDDSYLQGDMYQSYLGNILDTIKLLRELGFVIYPHKLVLSPSQIIDFLRFIISSKHRTLSLIDEKKNKIKTLLTNYLHSHLRDIRELARILGNIVATFSPVTFGPLHYRHSQRYKIRGLKHHKRNFEGKISLSSKAVFEIHWWINNIDNSCHHIKNISDPDITVHTDANLTGWGITNGISLS